MRRLEHHEEESEEKKNKKTRMFVTLDLDL